MLNPLKERIAEFDQKVTGVYDKESRERLSLQRLGGGAGFRRSLDRPHVRLG